MKIRFGSSVTVFSVLAAQILAPVAQAADRCPLSNPAYADIRLAAAKLQERLTLPAGCEKLEQELADAGASVKSAVDEVYKYDAAKNAAGTSTSTSTSTSLGGDDGEVKLKAAVDGVTAISGVFTKYTRDPRDKCGKELVHKVDYLEALIDTVNGLSPYLLVFGGAGAAPIALGATVLAGVAKSFMAFFHNNNIDMSDPRQRQVFIENSCAFYTFNENFEALQSKDSQLSESNAAIARLKSEIAELERIGLPMVPDGAKSIAELDVAWKKDQTTLQGDVRLLAQLSQSDVATCALIRARTQDKFGDMAVTRLAQLLDLSDNAMIDTTSSRSLIRVYADINKPELYSGAMGVMLTEEKAIAACAKAGREWLAQTTLVLAATDTELDRPGRRDVAFGEIRKTKGTIDSKKAELTRETERNKWLNSLMEIGEAIDNSEVTEIRDDSRDALFVDHSRHALFRLFTVRTKSPAESWLEQKVESTNEKLREYDGIAPRVRDLWLTQYPDPSVTPLPDEPTRKDACSSVKTLALTWLAARTHGDAAQSFCTVFRYTINDTLYKKVANYCFGTYNQKKKAYEHAFVGDVRANTAKRRAEVDQLYVWMTKANCPLPRKLELPTP